MLSPRRSAAHKRQRTMRVVDGGSRTDGANQIGCHRVNITRGGVRYILECDTCEQLFARKRDAENHPRPCVPVVASGLRIISSSIEIGTDGECTGSESRVRPKGHVLFVPTEVTEWLVEFGAWVPGSQ